MADRDWSELSIDLLEQVAKHLYCVEDFFSFRRVCRSWQSATLCKSLFQPILSKGVPWMMITHYGEDNGDNCTVFDLSTNKRYNLGLPEVGGRCWLRCWGTPYGWLITIDLNLDISLYNPLTRKRIQLPHQTAIQDYHDAGYDQSKSQSKSRRSIMKAVLGLHPSSSYENQFIVFASYRYRGLAFARPGDKAWTTIKRLDDSRCVHDITVFNGQLFVIDHGGDVFTYDIETSQLKSNVIGERPAYGVNATRGHFQYILEMDGELHIVRINDLRPGSDTGLETMFIVRKVDLCAGKLTTMESIKDHAIVVGRGSSLSISFADHPKFKEKLIYCSDKYRKASHRRDQYCTVRDLLVFDLYKNDFYRFIGLNCSNKCLCTFFSPNLW